MYDLKVSKDDAELAEKAATILSQMVFHSAEHRAQIVAALDKHNVRDINLDDYSVWGYQLKTN